MNFIFKKIKILKQESFRAFTAAYFRGAHGVVVVYDISDKNSFTCVKNWLRDIEKHCSDKNVVILLIGIKCDIYEKRLVSYEEALEFASQMEVLFFETSAKSGTNVEAAFQLIATQILINSPDNVSNNNEHYSSTINISSPDSCNQFC
jgi:Ras-related protein Rab-1A